MSQQARENQLVLLKARVGDGGKEYVLFQVKLDDVEELRKRINRLVLTNAVVPPTEGIMYVKKIPFAMAKELAITLKNTLSLPVLSFIGHESTVQLLTKEFGFEVPYNRGIYTPQPHDLAIAFRLKQRPNGDVKDIKPEDLDIAYVYYVS